ncbi:DUF1289 domain-containing protein [Roseococcus microcysteis]|nr:DUF1289 domain-containing protein [Roseococcus microcysteis]
MVTLADHAHLPDMASPCIDVCRFDEATGWCLGCGMAKPEKKRWKKDRDARPAVRDALPARLAALERAGHRTGKAAKRKKG